MSKSSMCWKKEYDNACGKWPYYRESIKEKEYESQLKYCSSNIKPGGDSENQEKEYLTIRDFNGISLALAVGCRVEQAVNEILEYESNEYIENKARRNIDSYAAKDLWRDMVAAVLLDITYRLRVPTEHNDDSQEQIEKKRVADKALRTFLDKHNCRSTGNMPAGLPRKVVFDFLEQFPVIEIHSLNYGNQTIINKIKLQKNLPAKIIYYKGRTKLRKYIITTWCKANICQQSKKTNTPEHGVNSANDPRSQCMVDSDFTSTIQQVVKECLEEQIDNTKRKILIGLYCNNKKQKDIARELTLTEVQVHRWKNDAIKQISAIFKSRRCDDFDETDFAKILSEFLGITFDIDMVKKMFEHSSPEDRRIEKKNGAYCEIENEVRSKLECHITVEGQFALTLVCSGISLKKVAQILGYSHFTTEKIMRDARIAIRNVYDEFMASPNNLDVDRYIQIVCDFFDGIDNNAIRDIVRNN